MQHPKHTDHDLTLIAAHAAGDLADSERTRAQLLIDTCGECADVHRDLIAIAAATRSLPNRATAPRDFRLSHEQAARLTRRGWLRTILAPLGTGSGTRPIAAAFTSLGIAGLLLATFLPGLMGSAASAPTAAERDQAVLGAAAGPTAAAAPRPSTAPVASTAPVVPAAAGGQPAPNATDSGAEYGAKDGNTATTAPDVAALGSTPTQAPRAAVEAGGRLNSSPTATNPLLIGSLALLAVGLLLFGLRFASRRLR